MNLVKWVDFTVKGDERGQLVVIEQYKNIPLAIKRVYYLIGTKPDVSRGFHAHKKLQQALVCVSGKCRILQDDGSNKENVWLDTPGRGILIDKMIWHEMHDFSEDCVLLVLASDYYDESDYIRSKEEFTQALDTE
jgi:dTDP-4-dehydrorhamnose 3,5-epimerase-like enzyme